MVAGGPGGLGRRAGGGGGLQDGGQAVGDGGVQAGADAFGVAGGVRRHLVAACQVGLAERPPVQAELPRLRGRAQQQVRGAEHLGDRGGERGRHRHLSRAQPHGVADAEQPVADMRYVVLRLHPDPPPARGPPGAPRTQALRVDRRGARVGGTGEPERHGPRPVAGRHGHERGAHLAGLEQLGALGRRRGARVEAHALVPGVGGQPRQVAYPAGRRYGQPERAQPSAFGLILHRLGKADQPLGRRQHVAAERGEHDPAGRPIDQPLAQMPFQRGDPAARHRLRHAHRRRAVGEAAVLADVDERTPRLQDVHARHVMPDQHETKRSRL